MLENRLSNKELYITLLSYLKPFLPIFSLAILASIGYSAVDAYIIKLLQPLVDNGIVGREQGFIGYLPIFLPLLFLFRGVCSFGSNYCMAWVSRKLVLNIRKDLFAHYLKLPTTYFDNNNSGELLSKMIYNADQLYKACTDIIMDVVREGFLIIFLFCVMLNTSWKLTLIFFIGGPIMGILFVVINKMFRKLTHKTLDAIGSVMHNTKEALDGQQVIRIFGGHEFIITKINKILVNYNDKEMRQALIKSISVPTIQFIGGAALSLTLYIALSGVIESSLTAGAFSTLFAGMIAILKPIKQVTNVNIYLQRALAAAENIFSTMQLPPEVDMGTQELTKVSGKIEFKNVNFRYDKQKELVLRNINFIAKPKQTIALVGYSGAGKSTLVKLLPRFYDEFSGEITLDDINIRDFKLANLRKHITMVSQNVVLFNESIVDNITYGQPKPIDQKKLIEVAKAAQAYDFIMELEHGFDTLVGENGIRLSGGQRQRIAIARALFKNAPILILDEATSALDTESERKIQLALNNLMTDRTTLVIAHRLSTIINADQIIVMEHGEIIEVGTHQQLLANNNLYAKLYNMQFNDDKVKLSTEDLISL
jgi:subfamily B ATP-binding cassette protein MsbA